MQRTTPFVILRRHMKLLRSFGGLIMAFVAERVSVSPKCIPKNETLTRSATPVDVISSAAKNPAARPRACILLDSLALRITDPNGVHL